MEAQYLRTPTIKPRGKLNDNGTSVSWEENHRLIWARLVAGGAERMHLDGYERIQITNQLGVDDTVHHTTVT
jgi:hypothetical protein